MNDEEKRLMDISTLTEVSNWLAVLPITEFGFEISKQQFSNLIGLRYGCENVQSTNICPRGRKFDIQQNMSPKKGSFTYIQLNDLRDLTVNMMSEVGKDTEIEPILTSLSGKQLQGRTSNNSNEARADIKIRGFWKLEQQGFFVLSVFDPNTRRYNKSLQQCYVMNEQEKKRAFNERILQIDHGTFKPLVFSINSSMGRRCQSFTRIWHN